MLYIGMSVRRKVLLEEVDGKNTKPQGKRLKIGQYVKENEHKAVDRGALVI